MNVSLTTMSCTRIVGRGTKSVSSVSGTMYETNSEFALSIGHFDLDLHILLP